MPTSFDYSSRDYDTIRSDLLARAGHVFPEWTDRDPSDFGMLFVDLWAYMADVMHFYIDRVAGESFLPTATQRESVLALANLLDYTPRGRSSAEAQLSIQNVSSVPVVIAPYTEFVARYNNTTYHAYTPLGGTAGSAGSVTLALREGQIAIEDVLTTAATGSLGQRYTISADNVVINSMRVFVYEDGVTAFEYVQVLRLSLAASGDRAYAVNVSPSGDIEVVFGTTLNGFIPPAGAKITVTYAASSGASGNLPSNSVTGFKAATPVGCSITSSTAFVGGVDEESIASLKRSIPSVVGSQNRAVTRNDFITLATQVAGVAKATLAFTPGAGVANASVTVYPQAIRSDYLTTTDTSQTVSAAMQADVVTALQSRALLGVNVYSTPTILWTPINISATVFVNERAVSNWVNRDVTTALNELFAFDNVFFGQRVTLGQVYRIILNVPGVDYINITVFSISGSGISSDILIDPLKLPKKGVYALTMSGGITVP